LSTTVILTAKPFVSEPTSFEVKTAIEKLKQYKLSGTYQILIKFIEAGGNNLCSEIYKLINSI
jgi:hypothetical protein